MRVRYFKVQGSGRFPLDMIRYDRCWPHRTEDAANMEGDYDAPLREVVLGTVADKVTVDRWRSFLWIPVDRDYRGGVTLSPHPEEVT